MWDQQTKEDQEKWNELAKKVSENPTHEKIFRLISNMSNYGKCLWCSERFEKGGIAPREMNDYLAINSLVWFTPEFLVHAKTVHGYDPDTVTDMLCSTITNDN
jgi:hypothetical protein